MTMFSFGPTRAVLTPCIGVCNLDARGYCEGCLRTGEEIALWSRLADYERLRIMRDVLPLREIDREQA